jgi:hypothetical protein
MVMAFPGSFGCRTRAYSLTGSEPLSVDVLGNFAAKMVSMVKQLSSITASAERVKAAVASRTANW